MITINQMFIDLDALIETWRIEDDIAFEDIHETLLEMAEVIEDLYGV